MPPLNQEQKLKKFEEMKFMIESEGYRLHSKAWNGFRGYIDLSCPKGHSYSVTWVKFKQGNRCPRCNFEKRGLNFKGFGENGVTRKEYQQAMADKFQKELESEGYKVISNQGKVKYSTNKTEIKVLCPNNHEWEVNWNKWDSGKRCRFCFEERMRKSTEEIRQELAREGCELIGEYKGSNYSFEYNCSCGGRGRTRIKDFRNGTRCNRCRGERNREKMRELRLKKIEEFDQSTEN
ncbi:hypothetical protein F4V43_02660 [Paenibacillus spiritus]|uniref:Uncharacterized protein n=1 Tax=Paenibacillus spiritus TaxID=2496557 RepID=A0A5J5GH42_9BACL|nr:hypothetical protein [Paenibacillus spiritus]KAA9007407.1 hypothetical protein F4V43_02660 [Paenibacillus spiritus]